MLSYYYCLLNEKKSLKKFGPRTWCTKKTFRLSSHTPGYSLKSCPGQKSLMPKSSKNKCSSVTRYTEIGFLPSKIIQKY